MEWIRTQENAKGMPESWNTESRCVPCAEEEVLNITNELRRLEEKVNKKARAPLVMRDETRVQLDLDEVMKGVRMIEETEKTIPNLSDLKEWKYRLRELVVSKIDKYAGEGVII